MNWRCSNCNKLCYVDSHNPGHVFLDCHCKWPAQPIKTNKLGK